MSWGRPHPEEADTRDILKPVEVALCTKRRDRAATWLLVSAGIMNTELPHIPVAANLFAAIPLAVSMGRLLRYNDLLLAHDNAAEQHPHALQMYQEADDLADTREG